MRPRSNTLLRRCGLIAVAWFVLPVFAQESEEADTSAPRGGWVVTGRTVPLPVGRPGGVGMPAGELIARAPARMLQDLFFANDTIWIGTEGGLFAYIPETDTIVGIEGPMCGSVSSIARDDDGALWVGGVGGISVRSDGWWRHYGAGRHRLFSHITELVAGDGRIWVGTYGEGCGYITADSIRSFSREDSLLDERVTAIVEEDPSTVWFGTASGLCRSDTLRWESMRYGHRIPIGAVNDCILDEAGDLFLAVMRQGVVWYSLGRVRMFGPDDGLPSWEINAFDLDPTGRVWAAGDGGVSVYDGSGWVPHRHGGASLAGYRFLSICHDLEGRSYLGTDGGVLLVHSRESAREVAVPQGFPDGRVRRIRRFGDELWFLTDRHIYRNQHVLQPIAQPGDWLRGAMADFVVDGAGELWAATRFGILHRLEDRWEVYDRRQGLPTEHCVAVARAGDGDLWFGTFDRGILRLSPLGWINYTEANGLPDDRIDAILVDGGGTPWAVAGEGAVARFRGDSWERIPLPAAPDAQSGADVGGADTTGALDPSIRFLENRDEERLDGEAFPRVCMGLDGTGRCVVATPRGIYRFTGSGWRIISAPAVDGGIDPTAVLIAKSGVVWLGTAARGVFARQRREWLRLGTHNGLTDDHILSIAEDAEGTIWIGTRCGGLNRFKPAAVF